MPQRPSKANAPPRTPIAILCAASLAAAGCTAVGGKADSRQSPSDDGASSDFDRSRPIEFFSWWSPVGDADALRELMREHQRHFADSTIINATAELSGLARAALRLRMNRNEPPDTFQANAGTDLMQWVLVNGVDDLESKLLPLDDLVPDVATWRRTIPSVLLDDVSYGGKLYAIPTNVHRINCLYLNKHVFGKFGLVPPKTVDDMLAMGAKLSGSGVPVFSMGTSEPWTLALFAFEDLLVAREGASFYENYFRGNGKSDDPRIVADLFATSELMGFVNEDHAQLSWVQSADRFSRGDAAMLVMGDWARGYLNGRGLVLGRDYEEIAFPGSEDTFVYTSDTFPLPRLAKNRAGAIRLLRTMGSEEGQRLMNAPKNALSARIDVPPAGDPILVEKHALLEHGRVVLALSGLVSPRFAVDLGAALAEMIVQADPEPVIHTLRSRYAILK